MMRRLLLAVVALGIAAGFAFWVVTMPRSISASALPARTANPANGEVMFNAGGCANCHASREDRTRLVGGLALKSPFGVFHVPNISPDPDDGIGRWTEAQFVTAMTEGTSPSGRHYYPAFPYGSYRTMRIDDIRDLFAYLKTLPAAQGRVRDHELPFPYNIRQAVGVWKALYLDGMPFAPDPSRSAEWNRGAYLVNGPAHCGECHTPRTALGGLIRDQALSGAPNPEGEGRIPDITQKALGDWTEDDFAELLTSGNTPSFDSVSGSMDLVIRSTSQLPEADRRAMAVYLKSVPGPR